MNANPYLPLKAEITDIIQETTSPDLDVKTYRLKFPEGESMDFMPGQFVELGIPGVGEAPFGFASNPLIKDSIEITIKRTGSLTEAVHMAQVGDHFWLRGPYGNTFPIDKIEGHDLLYVAGGIGLSPLRPLITYVFDAANRDKFGKINMLLAARSSKDFSYFYEYQSWREMKDTSLLLTIDNPEPDWQERVGFPNNLVAEIDFDMDKTIALLCGPPIMIKLVSGKLMELGLPKDRIITTLEMRMTCGVGKCGKCNIGRKYVCIDGPVFTLAELDEMPNEY